MKRIASAPRISRQFGSGAAAQAGEIHLQPPSSRWKQVECPEREVSHESLRRAFQSRHLSQPPSEVHHFLGRRPSQRVVRVEVALVLTARYYIGQDPAEDKRNGGREAPGVADRSDR